LLKDKTFGYWAGIILLDQIRGGERVRGERKITLPLLPLLSSVTAAASIV
jgi:hypothetical protein